MWTITLRDRYALRARELQDRRLPANAAFVAAVPDQQRGQAFGLAVAGMNLGQGTAMILAGAAAQHLGPAAVIAAAGAAGIIATAMTALADRRPGS